MNQSLPNSLKLLSLILCSFAAYAEQTLAPVEVYSGADGVNSQTAQSQQTISAEELAQRQPSKLEEMVVYLPNVQAARVGAGGSEDFIIRGFSLGGRLLLDGVLDNQSLFVRDPATIENVEFIKGHASVLYGAGAPGGTVNFIAKRPKSLAENSFSVVLGNDNYKRLVIDSTGSLNNSKKLSYRTIFAGTDTDTWKENVHDRQFTLMNTLDWRYSAGGKLSATYEIAHQTYPWDFDNVYAHGKPVYDVSYVHPATYADRNYQRLTLAWEQALDAHSWLEAGSNIYRGDRNERRVGFYYMSSEDEPLVGFYQQMEDDYLQVSSKLSYLRNYQLGKWQGTWQVGLSHNRLDDNFDNDRAVGTFGLDIYHPDFNIVLPTEDQLSPRDTGTAWYEKAFYAYNEIALNDQLSLSFGVRQSQYDFLQTRNGYVTQDNNESDRSYSAGVIWSFVPTQKLFVSYSESFLPNITTDSNDKPFKPKEGVQYELGWLYQPSKALSLQITAFDITQSNLLTRDPNDPGNSILAGTYKAKGIELASQWQLNDTWKAVINFGRINAYVADNNDGYEGNEFFSTPKKNGSLWLSYQANPKWLLQAGAVYQGKRAGDLANSFYVDAYTRYDAAIQYQADKQNRVNFSVQNFTDINYVSYSSLNDFVRFGDPITFRVSYYHQF